VACYLSRYIPNWFSSCIGRYLGRGALVCRTMKVWRKRMPTLILRLVSPPQQELSRLLHQRHARFLRSYRRHSLHHDLHKKTNLTTVVGETFGTPFAAYQAAIAAPFLLYNLPPLNIFVIRRFHDHTIYLFEFLSYTYLRSHCDRFVHKSLYQWCSPITFEMHHFSRSRQI